MLERSTADLQQGVFAARFFYLFFCPSPPQYVSIHSATQEINRCVIKRTLPVDLTECTYAYTGCALKGSWGQKCVWLRDHSPGVLCRRFNHCALMYSVYFLPSTRRVCVCVCVEQLDSFQSTVVSSKLHYASISSSHVTLYHFLLILCNICNGYYWIKTVTIIYLCLSACCVLTRVLLHRRRTKKNR